MTHIPQAEVWDLYSENREPLGIDHDYMNLFQITCPQMIRCATELLEEMLQAKWPECKYN